MKTAANTLYDLLEINRSASQDAITAAYQRLRAKFAGQMETGNEDATNRMIALREAYGTLSDPERRRRYDDKLSLREYGAAPASGQPRSFLGVVIVAALLVFGALSYSKYQSSQEKARLERERIAAETKAAELAMEREKEERQALLEAERQRFQNEATERIKRERDIAYANQVSRNLAYAEQQARREEQRETQREAQKHALAERQRLSDAERQLAKDKAYLRQLQAENGHYRGY